MHKPTVMNLKFKHFKLTLEMYRAGRMLRLNRTMYASNESYVYRKKIEYKSVYEWHIQKKRIYKRAQLGTTITWMYPY
jgi:coenzyme F420-reducing hydrogenase beta subunit